MMSPGFTSPRKDTTLRTPTADPTRADRLAYYLLKAVNKANRLYRLFAEGDRVLVAVSGGKDSMTLVDLLRRRQAAVRDDYRLVVGHIRTDYHCGRAVPAEWLRQWCAAHDLPCTVDEIRVATDLAATTVSRCFRCAWHRRKALFEMATRLGCNKLAFAHHADDAAETALMNLFYNARLRGLEPRLPLFGGELTVIRPLVLIEERDIVPFVRASGFPVQGEPCPAGEDSQRAVVKGLLRQLERDCHDVKRHIYRAVEYHKARQGRAAASGARGPGRTD